MIGFRSHGVRAEWAHLPEAGSALLARARRTLEGAGLDAVVTV